MINITKGWPNMYAVDLAIPVAAAALATLVEGMAISLTSGEWVKGVGKGKMGYVTLPGQFPTALDVARVQATAFSNGAYPLGVAEMGRKNMGGIALSNALEFQTDQYSTLAAGELTYSPAGTFIKATTTDHQILGWCRTVQSDLIAGNSSATNWQGGTTVATIVALPMLILP